MAKLMTGSINLSKIDKSKLFTGKTGDKYLNVTIWVNDEEDQYGNIASVQQSLSKEEREGGAKAIYVGNLKEPGRKSQSPQQASAAAQSVADDDDMPF